MVNRSLQAKSLKLKRAKRLFPRYLSADYVPTGKPPNMLVMRELKERSKSLAFDDEYADYLAKRRLMDLQGQHISIGRQEVMAHIQRIEQVAPALQCVDLMNSRVCRVRMFYPSERNRFILLENNFLQKFIRTSMVYQDRMRLIAAFKSDRVRWVHFSSVSPPTNSTD